MACLLTFALCAVSAFAQGIKPVGKDGKPLNLDFEEGTLRNWIAEGAAFEMQPVRGDTVAQRRNDMKSGHQGNFWIGTFEIGGDDLKGTLTSVPFTVTHQWAAFWVGGGARPGTFVGLYDALASTPFFKVTGEDHETLRPVVVDLKERIGKEIFIRVVDEQRGHWGHINFDDFKFYAQRPQFPNEIDPKKQAEVPEADVVLHAGLSPEDAIKAMTLPPGFKATMFAAEPDVQQPIAFCLDDRGRLWVAEGHTYPIRVGKPASGDKAKPTDEQLKDIFGGKDRIVVLEDTDGDGKFNRRTVFAENLNLVSGIEYGFSGIWVGAAPYLMFIPIADGDEPKPAGKPKILLDGWGWQDTHETLNTFKWGPDGWLYGCHGVFTHSNVGKPGAPDTERTKINAGIWRYHPTKHLFEVFAEGTSNPWGIDFDEHGQLFAEACVIPHLFHIIQGARYHRQAGSHFNPYIYDDIKTCADHVHYAGNKGPHAGNNRSDAAGGGHAHAGLMIYQGDNWPAEYRGKILIGNIHGQRINMDVPERKGSGFVVKHAPDPIHFNDKWSQVIDFRTGPDGGVYFIDWYDRQQCHNNKPEDHDRSNGRIYKITHGTPKFEKVDLQRSKDQELILTQGKAVNNWYAAHARRILQERRQTLGQQVTFASLEEPLISNSWNSKASLRTLWTLHAVHGLTEDIALTTLQHDNEFVRAWTIQLIAEDMSVSRKQLEALRRLAREDKSPVVRLYLASALQRIPAEQRWEILEGLYSHSEDANDHNLPLMVWYAAEPLVALDAKRALQMAENAKLPNILNFTVRRTAALGTPEAMSAIIDKLKTARDEHATFAILAGLSTALKGQRSAPMPAGWEEIETKLARHPNGEVRALVQSLGLTFGSPGAQESLKQTVLNKSAEPAARRTALESLLSAKPDGLPAILQSVLNEPELRGPAIRGLAAYDDPQTPLKIFAAYNSFEDHHKRDALNTLVSRVGFAKALVQAIGREELPRRDLPAGLIRQLRNFKDSELNADLEKVYGAIRETAADKKRLLEKYKQL